jgi:hypothetical protein
MLKRLTSAFCILLFACWIAGFGIAVFRSSQHPKGTQQNKPTSAPEQKNQKDIGDERLADYTLLLAWFTGVLAVSTVGLWIVTWRGGDKQSRDTQESLRLTAIAATAATAQAEIARKALTDIERPYLFIFNVSRLTVEDFFDMDEEEIGHALKASYDVANHGKIPAIIESLHSNLSVFTDPLDPLAADYNHPLVIAPVLAAGEKRADIPVDIGWNDMGTNEYGNTVPNFGQHTLFLRVVIGYRGPFTRGHETSIGLRYDERTNRFVEFYTGEKYNYQT